MPKAKPFSAQDEEKTTIDAPWEDEASTTVDQGELANKIKSLGEPVKSNTNVTQTGTGLDEPTVDDQSASPVLSAITPIRPDNNARILITQGNDVGQEFEIRPGKTYTIGRALDNDIVLTDIAVSRKHFDLRHEDGSWIIVDRGSGNGTIVNGNIEDNPFMLASGDVIEIGNTVFRYEQPNGVERPSNETYDIDDEELSTVAGKPVRTELDDVPPASQRPARPKTMPPPAPQRSRNASAAPPLAFGSPPQPLPASTLPMPQMANRPPLGAPNATSQPSMLGDARGIPPPAQSAQSPGLASGAPGPSSTLPGQGPARGYPYPQASEIPPHSVHAQMMLIQTQNRRGDASTAHVQPVPFDSLQMSAAQRYIPPPLSRRAKLVLGGLGLAVLAGIVTAAVIKSDPPAPAAATASAKADSDTEQGTDAKADSKVTTTPIVEPIKSDRDDDKEIASIEMPGDEEVRDTSRDDSETARSEDKDDDKDKDEPKVAKAKPEPRVVRREPKREVKREIKREAKRAPEPKRDRAPEPKRVATLDVEAARNKADDLYREKKFREAASVLSAAAKNASGSEAKDLRYKSGLLTKLGKAYATGTAPAQKANVAFESLQQASTYDRTLGGAFDGDLQTRLASLAPKAAVAYLGRKEYARARTAVIAAQRYGSNDSNLQLVKQKLESIAGELYKEAAKEIKSNPGPAKEKLRLVKSMVDPKSSWAVKAEQLLKRG